MDVRLLRIDSRLIHGQVADNWAGSLGTEAILAVSDGAANDELHETLMLQTGGGRMKARALRAKKAARICKNPKYGTPKAVIVVETPADIVCLLGLGIGVKEVSIDSMVFKQGTSQVSRAAYANPADVEAFKEIDSHGIKQYIQQVPSATSPNLTGAPKGRGLL